MGRRFTAATRYYNNDDIWDWIVLGFNDTSTPAGHFVSSPREREKRDRRNSRIDEREEQRRKRNRSGMKVKKQKK